MKSCSTPNVYTLIIETRLDDKPSNMFIPTIIVSKDESALVERMIKTFTFSLDRLESSDGGVYYKGIYEYHSRKDRLSI